MRVNALCLPAGHARVEEGSEHFLFYALESRLGRGFKHGHVAGLGVHILSVLSRYAGGEAAARVDLRSCRGGDGPHDITAATCGPYGRQPAGMGINEAPITEAWVDGVALAVGWSVLAAARVDAAVGTVLFTPLLLY